MSPVLPYGQWGMQVAKIRGFRVRNYKVLRDVTLGRLWDQRESQPLTDLTAVIGKNGVGKSALFDAFGFLADALNSGVEVACGARGRGGFERIRSLGAIGPIEFEVFYKEVRMSGRLPTRWRLMWTSPDALMCCEKGSGKDGRV